MTSHRLEPAPGTTRDVFSRDHAPVLTVDPGDTVTVGCGAVCGVGTCSGDTVLRVCAGTQTCSGSVALAQNDDCQPNAGCFAATFTCTAAGQYTVMWGPYSPGASATCNLAHSP